LPAGAADEELLASSQAIAEPVLDPRASIGDVNCADLTIPITLDNGRSTGAYGFVTAAYVYEDYENETSYFRETLEVAAGATQVVQIPVAEANMVTIEVEHLAFGVLDVSCGENDPRAGIGDPDCSSFTIPITLDNSGSPSGTTFWVALVNVESLKSFVVPAGAKQVVQVEVTEDSFETVIVSLASDGSNWLALEDITVYCVPRQGWTTATVGDFDCRTRTFPITIDNSDVTETTEVWVLAESRDFQIDDFFSFEETFRVASGAVQVVRVRGPASNQRLDVNVSNLDEPQTPTENLNLAYRDLQINCPTTAARPTVAVQGAKRSRTSGASELPQTGGLNVALPVLGVALLAGGAGMLALSGRIRRSGRHGAHMS
jgi:LPXTG-motif cell wall-anchored protein